MKYSKNGTNPCQCIVRTPEADPDSDTWAYRRSCGGKTHREFVQGHDARLKSEIMEAFRANKMMAVLEDGGILITKTPFEWANEREWTHFLTKSPKQLRTEAKATAATQATEAEVAQTEGGATPQEPQATVTVPTEPESTPTANVQTKAGRRQAAQAANVA